MKLVAPESKEALKKKKGKGMSKDWEGNLENLPMSKAGTIWTTTITQ